MTAFEQALFTISMPITLRIAEKSDIPRLEWYGQYRHYRNLFRRVYREQLRGRRLILVADCNGFPIGHVFIQFKSTNAHIADGVDRAYLYAFRVMEMFQGRGIGTRLIGEAESILVDRGFCSVTIAAAKINIRALNLYERLGYHIVGDDPGKWSYVDHLGRIRQVEEPCWVLEKILTMRYNT